ncbi:beta/gamma crystallin domain-containing protein 1-like [Gadus macrocephalus]|uniref:beta/gamma crystallin domain-containing protein 1-like n=1 Tax=Gadus macrocephalus TaxID=80720 RepID=UPI0028CB4549|nr:beta/gamma crystallin domain-containing protein 1-like [Gadus macrocephalus]
MTTTDRNMMGKITFYEEKNFQGRSYECMSDCSDMSSHMSRCQSCRVESGCFMLYEKNNYMGQQFFMRRGEYNDMHRMQSMGMMFDNIRSCRMIPFHRGQFRMKIYERENFGGQSNEMMDDCDNIQDRYRMSDCQSCHVMDGHWLMYEQPQYRGKMMYMRPGEYRSFRDMGMSGQRFMSMRRITDMYLPPFPQLLIKQRLWRNLYFLSNVLKYDLDVRLGLAKKIQQQHQHHSSSMTTTGMNMGKITFYEEKNFQGRSYECMSDCSDMSSYMSRCQSCRVDSGCFMVYEKNNYMGQQFFMRRGEHNDMHRMQSMGMMFDNIRSCRMIPFHRGQFRMKIYEREDFGGQSNEMMDDCDNIQERYRMSDCQSCNVMDGHWLMYEQPHYKGRMMYMRPGEYRSFRDMGMSGQRFMSMRRITDMC